MKRLLQIAALFALIIPAASLSAGTWVWDGGAALDRWGNAGGSQNYQNNWDLDTNPATVLGVTPTVVFDDTYVTSDPTIQIRDTDKTVHSITFSGQYSYRINRQTGINFIIDNGTGGGTSTIGTVSSLSGNVDHTINAEIVANNDLTISHQIDTDLDFLREIDMGANTLTVDSEATTKEVRIARIRGSGDLEKTGSGNLYLSANNVNFTGETTVQEGTLRVNSKNSLGSGSAQVTVDSGATLQLESAGAFATKDLYISGSGVGGNGALRAVDSGTTSTWTGSVILEDDTTVAAGSGATLRINGVISGAHDLTVTDVGTVHLRGNNTFTGDTTVEEGTLRLNTSGGGQALGATANVEIQSGGTILLNRDNQINDSADMLLSGGILDMNSKDETLDTLTFSTNSTIMLGSGSNADLNLTSLLRTGGQLTIDEYTADGQINVSTTVDQTTLFNIYFDDQGILGATQLLSGDIVPAPEPSTYILGGVIALAIAFDIWRRRRGDA